MVPAAVGIGVAALISAVVVTVLLLRSGGLDPGNPPTAASPSASSIPTTGSVPTSRATTDSSEMLSAWVVDGRDTAENLLGYWVPQVSSKAIGTVDASGLTYGQDEVLADFLAWRASFPDAILLRSEDYSSFRSPGYWVTVVPRPYATAEDANRWCDSAGLLAENCFAKRLLHTGGPEGNAVPR